MTLPASRAAIARRAATRRLAPLAQSALLGAMLAFGAMPARAQATTTELGHYTLCRIADGGTGQNCHAVSLTTAPRRAADGSRSGTTGVVTLRNLQGVATTLAGGQVVASGAGASAITGVSFFTQGCLPGEPCASPDFFDGVHFGTLATSDAVPGAVGPVGGAVPGWSVTVSKPVAADNPSILRFDAGLRYVGPWSNVQLLGIGGCATGFADLANQFRDVVQAARTCAPQGHGGAVTFGFETAAVFDPTYLVGLRIDWAQQHTPGGTFFPYACIASGSRGGVFSAGGHCVASALVTAVPEPATTALFGAGGALLAALARRRRFGREAAR